jgi:hypothetical protein
VFAAQFALSHACWLVTYPLAGQLGEAFGMAAALAVLGALALAGTGAALVLWPRADPQTLAHAHPDLPADHPHLRAHGAAGAEHRHAHDYVIDDEHLAWPHGA